MPLREALIVLAALLIASGPAGADELTPEKRADIERLLEMTGSLDIGKQFATAVSGSMAEALLKARPDIPREILDLLPAEVGAVFEENIGSFKEEFIPIYHKYFSGAELKGMIEFYSTDLGRKMISTMPAIMADGFAAGQRWGQSLGPQIGARVTAKLKEKGIDLEDGG